MMNFACKKFTVDDIIKCSLNLTKSECRLFQTLLYEDEELTVKEIANQLKIDRTTVQKGIKSLVEKSILIRLQENLEKGGYTFRYKIKDKEIVRNMIKKNISQWYNEVLVQIGKW